MSNKPMLKQEWGHKGRQQQAKTATYGKFGLPRGERKWNPKELPILQYGPHNNFVHFKEAVYKAARLTVHPSLIALPVKLKVLLPVDT